MTKVYLKRGRDESVRRFHPWIFSGAVAQVAGNPAEGDIVAVYSAEGDYLAIEPICQWPEARYSPSAE